jgi:hypothetical protein
MFFFEFPADAVVARVGNIGQPVCHSQRQTVP